MHYLLFIKLAIDEMKADTAAGFQSLQRATIIYVDRYLVVTLVLFNKNAKNTFLHLYLLFVS